MSLPRSVLLFTLAAIPHNNYLLLYLFESFLLVRSFFLSFFLSVCPSVCPSVCLPVCLSFYLYFYLLSFFLSFFSFSFLSFLSFLSFCLSFVLSFFLLSFPFRSFPLLFFLRPVDLDPLFCPFAFFLCVFAVNLVTTFLGSPRNAHWCATA